MLVTFPHLSLPAAIIVTRAQTAVAQLPPSHLHPPGPGRTVEWKEEPSHRYGRGHTRVSHPRYMIDDTREERLSAHARLARHSRNIDCPPT